ncbi:hypothetical protein ABZS29_17925 [Kribbella sp. NPDC005582]|uniref:hypothetical protein n=1 Tax=Kribbella sp. NPDC005582 TaxID=3156893 RepID=UPI0033A89EAB
MVTTVEVVDHLEAWKKAAKSQSDKEIATRDAVSRERLIEVNAAAARFHRRELMRDKKSWVRDYLMRGGVPELLAPDSHWALGYAPDARSRLVDHLRSQGFSLATVRDAGLGILDADGRTVDRFRDQLMLPARNDRLQVTGFIGLRTGQRAPYYASSPTTAVHRRSASLIGVAEQLDLLDGEAQPILVNNPLDAFAIERLSRLGGGRWIGIPLCDTLLSAEQTRILGSYTAADTVIVLVTGKRTAQQVLTDCYRDLTGSFRRVQAVELPRGQTPARIALAPGGLQRLHDALRLTRPLVDYRSSRGTAGSLQSATDVDEAPGPELP